MVRVPIEHQPTNGRVHLSADVLRLDDHRRIYRRHRRRLRELAFDILFRFVMPVMALILAAMALIGFIWVLLAIGRAIRYLGGL